VLHALPIQAQSSEEKTHPSLQKKTTQSLSQTAPEQPITELEATPQQAEGTSDASSSSPRTGQLQDKPANTPPTPTSVRAMQPTVAKKPTIRSEGTAPALVQKKNRRPEVAIHEADQASVHLSVLLDIYFSYNPRRGDGDLSDNRLHAFSRRTDEFAINIAKIDLDYHTDTIAFVIDLLFGPGAEIIAGRTDPTEFDGSFIFLQQAFVRWQALSWLAFKSGRFVTHIGLESIETTQNWNYTHSFLFQHGPFHQTGLATELTLSEHHHLSFFLVNGLDNTFDVNGFIGPGFQYVYAPREDFSVTVNGATFNEEPEARMIDFNEAIYMLDLVAKANLKLIELGLNANLAADTGVAYGKWFGGIALYAKRQLIEQAYIAMRNEFFYDSQSRTFNTAVNSDLWETSFTLAYRIAKPLELRVDSRVDYAFNLAPGTAKPFTDASGQPTDWQLSFTFGAIASY